MTARAREYLERIVQAWNDGRDEAVVSIHHELNQDQALYLEVWGALPSTLRRQFKDLIASHDQ